MNPDDIDLLSKTEIPESIRSKIAEQIVGAADREAERALEAERLASERKKFLWNTPVVAAIAGLLTLTATFVFDRIIAKDQTDNTITLEQVRNELQQSEVRLRQELELAASESHAKLETEAKEREFQYEIVRSEFTNSEKTNAERAAVLLFLVRAGVLSSLNEDELREMAEQQIERPNETIIPQLTSSLQMASEFKVGLSANELDTRRDVIRMQETTFGNLVTDAMLEAYREDINTNQVRPDFAMISSGLIRGNKIYPRGTILTRLDLLFEMPFANSVVLVSLSGAEIKMILENALELGRSAFPQVSGLSITYDSSKPVGARIVQINVDGAPLENDISYNIVTADVNAGGLDWPSMAEAIAVEHNSNGRHLADIVLLYIGQRGTVSPSIEGRLIDVR